MKENKSCSTIWLEPEIVFGPYQIKKVRIEEDKSCSTTWLGPKIVFESQKSPLGPQKVKNDPKIKSKSKVRIEENIENKSYSTSWVVPKTVF